MISLSVLIVLICNYTFELPDGRETKLGLLDDHARTRGGGTGEGPRVPRLRRTEAAFWLALTYIGP